MQSKSSINVSAFLPLRVEQKDPIELSTVISCPAIGKSKEFIALFLMCCRTKKRNC